jgi:hypothetical protein
MKPQNLIIAITFLVLISIFSFSFETITGNPVKLLKPEIKIDNDNIKAGKPIQIRIKINEHCVDPRIEFYSPGGIRKDRRTFKPTEDDCATQNFRTCKGNKYCRGDLKNDEMVMTYYTLPSWKTNPGIYKVRANYIEKPGQERHRTPHIEQAFRIISQ